MKQVPESFAEIAATSTPGPATNTIVESTQKENGEKTASETSVDRVSELEKKVHAGINSARATHGVSPQLKWDERLSKIARAHSEDMTRREVTTGTEIWKVSVQPSELRGLDIVFEKPDAMA